jgi:cytochrome d ubiquinol oxidase subunit I
LASWLSDPSTGKNTVVQGLTAVPPDQRPTVRQINLVHLCWDIMVGLGTALFLLAVWYAMSWIFRRRMPQTKWFLRAAAVAGPAAVLTMEAGWVVTEVGRQPWIVYGHMRVEDAATTNPGVWITFFAVVILYVLVGTMTILVLRGMGKRFRETPSFTDRDTPYGPSALTEASTTEAPARAEETVG